MEGYGPHTYGESFADVYDDWYATVSDVEATVEAIHAMADGGRVLELGVGTGRLALPLAARGVRWSGSMHRPMLDRLRVKDSESRVATVRADHDRPLPSGGFAVVFAAFNTFFNLPDDGAQRRCMTHVATALDPGGRFVVEGFIPPGGPRRRRGVGAGHHPRGGPC
ncbi:MAG: class I SAM-dependent methyltransferase [Acidimicrobiales bacterium]